MVKQRTLCITGTLLAIVALGCAFPTRRNDWSTYSGPGAEYFRAEELEFPDVDDPLEPSNRVAWAVNDFLLFDVVAPISAGWRFVVPQPVRTCLVNAARNLTYPVRLVSNLLQGEVEHAGEETRRFLVNSTAGVLGLFDVAGRRPVGKAEMGEEDIGRAFVHWGWEESTYLVWPLFGPRTTRDTLGLVGDIAVDPLTYVPYAGGAKAFIVGSEQIDEAKRLVRTSYDPYGMARVAWTASRAPLEELTPKAEADPLAVHVLRALNFQLADPWFPSKARTHRVLLTSTNRKMAYEVWLQPEPAPMVFVVPGLGGHRRSKSTMAAAELVYLQGFSAVTISSSMCFDFMETAATVSLPGYAPADVKDVHVALDAVHHDLERRYPGRVIRRILMGLSLGAFHTVYLAAAGKGSEGELVDFERYVALGPPVDLRYALEKLDSFYNSPLIFAKEEREPWVRQTLGKAARAGLVEASPDAAGVVFNRFEAEFLIGMSFRWALHEVIWQSQKNHDLGVLKTPLRALRRGPSTREILEYSYQEYFYAFMLPYFMEKDASIQSAEQLLAQIDLRSLSLEAETREKIRVFANQNDYLITDEQVRWLTETFPKGNVTIEPTGGHLGVLFEAATRDRIMESLEDLR